MSKLRKSRIIVVVLLAVVVAATFGFHLRAWAGERYLSGRPAQFSSWAGAERTGGYGSTLAIGHNAGDDVGTTQRALASGAAYIEIDVIYDDGELYAAHTGPVGTFRSVTWTLAPPLRLIDAWRQSAKAAAIELDLKDASPASVQKIVNFVEDRNDPRPLLIASKSPAVLTLFAEKLPGALRILSIDTPAALSAFQSGDASTAALDGVTVRDGLLTASSIQGFKQDGLIVLAWTINDPVRLDQLIGLGVDGVATDNLAITSRLKHGEIVWPRLAGDPQPA